ncbi:MAG: hypothetical protein ACQER9_04965 [Nanobdellota archaeon]
MVIHIYPDSYVLAEGVENKEQVEILKSIKNLDLAQGYYFAKFNPAEVVYKNL